MGRKRIKGTKYNKVSKQQKYIFLKLCISGQESIHQAAFHADIHYSTAKTILFFHKKHYKNYTQFNVNPPLEASPSSIRAGYTSIPIDLDSQAPAYPRIELISSMHMKNSQWKKSMSSSKESTQSVKEQQLESDFVKMEQMGKQKNQEKAFGRSTWREGSGMREEGVRVAQKYPIRND